MRKNYMDIYTNIKQSLMVITDNNIM